MIFSNDFLNKAMFVTLTDLSLKSSVDQPGLILAAALLICSPSARITGRPLAPGLYFLFITFIHINHLTFTFLPHEISATLIV